MYSTYKLFREYNFEGYMMKVKKAVRNFIFWVSISIIVNFIVFIISGKEVALEYLGGYVVELSLSVDNLFLFLMIFTNFNIPQEYQKRVLTYGIIGAMVLRFIFIFLGITIINKFYFVTYIFSVILIFSGFKMMIKEEDKSTNYSDKKIVKFLKGIIPFTDEIEGEYFFIRKNTKLYATPLFLILLLIESSDIIFAMDSIPAIFSITTNVVIVYLSNIFAIIGLRSLYFILSKLNSMFKGIQYGVGCILIFTGIKLLLIFFNITIPTLLSLIVIVVILFLSILLSFVF